MMSTCHLIHMTMQHFPSINDFVTKDMFFATSNVMILSSTSPRIAGNMWGFQPSCGKPQAPGLDFLPCRLVDWWRGVFIDGQSVGADGTAG